MTENMKCIDCEAAWAMPEPTYCCDDCGCYTCTDCHVIDDDTGEVICSGCSQNREEKEREEEEEEVEEYETCWICKKTDTTVHTIDYWPGHSGHDITICSACNNEECESCGTKDGTVVPHLYGNTLSMMVCAACK